MSIMYIVGARQNFVKAVLVFNILDEIGLEQWLENLG